MSDADRLREAAKEADRTAVYLHGTMTPTMHRVADLLRAVADSFFRCQDCYDLPPGVYCQAHTVAFTLADTILGSQS